MQRLAKRFTASCLALSILGTTACQTGEQGDDERQEQRAFTGEEVFEGVFFGVGPVAELVPELFEVNPDLLGDDDREQARRLLADDATTPAERTQARERLADDQAFVEMKTAVLSWIHDADPTFIERFGEAMQSGDHLEIDEMLDESLTVMGEVRKAHPEVFGEITDQGRGTGWIWFGTVAINWLAVVNAVAAVNAAAAANGAWVFNVVSFWWGGGTDKEHSPLARERAVDLLVERLATE